MTKASIKTGGFAADLLRSIVDRVETLEEQKAEIAADIRDVFAEAKGNGLDPKTIREIIKLRKMDASERDEREALLDIYKAALGMLNDTPLGEAAIRKFTRKPDDAEPETNEKPQVIGKDIDEARKMGKEAAKDGDSITSNPFPARDPRRAAWDEAYCSATGSDGMEIPDAWRKAPKKKDKDDAPDEQAA